MARALLWVVTLATAGCIDAPTSGDGAHDADAAPKRPDAGSALLRNPGFEEGVGVGWVFEPGGSPRIATSEQLGVEPHGGEYAAEVGGNNDQNDAISQEVDVPEGVTELTVRFHRCVLSEEPEGDEWDFCDVRAGIGDELPEPLYRESNLDATPTCGWMDTAVAVPFTAGQPVRFLLIGTNDNDAPTRCLYDSFELIPTF